jgi:hypothetical protein
VSDLRNGSTTSEWIERIKLLEELIPRAGAALTENFYFPDDGFRPRRDGSSGTRAVSHALSISALLGSAHFLRFDVRAMREEWLPKFEVDWTIKKAADLAPEDRLLSGSYASSLVVPALTRVIRYIETPAPGADNLFKLWRPRVNAALETISEWVASLDDEPAVHRAAEHAMFIYHARQALAYMDSYWKEQLADYSKPSSRLLEKAIDKLSSVSERRLQYLLAMISAVPDATGDALQLAYLTAALDVFDNYTNDVLLDQAARLSIAHCLTDADVPRVHTIVEVGGASVATSSLEALAVLAETRFVRASFRAVEPEYDKALAWLRATQRSNPVDPIWLAEPWRGRDEPEAWVNALVLRFLVQLLDLTRRTCRARILREFGADSSQPPVRWTDVVDSDELKESLEQGLIVPAKDDIDAGRPLRAASALLFGPPGTAKTTIAHALAGELRWPLVTISPHAFAEDGLDGVIRRARTIFEKLMVVSDCVILFDELDELVSSRDDDYDKMNRFITTSMLPWFQDLRKQARVVFLATTNHIERFDPAIKRPGRFDVVLPVGPPDDHGQVRLLNTFLARDLARATGDISSAAVLADMAKLAISETAIESENQALVSDVESSRWRPTIGELEMVADAIARRVVVGGKSKPERFESAVTEVIKLASDRPMIDAAAYERFRDAVRLYRFPVAGLL